MSSLSGPACTPCVANELVFVFCYLISFLFPVFTWSFCFMSSLSGPACTLGVANELIFCFSVFRLTLLTAADTFPSLMEMDGNLFSVFF